MAENDTAKGSGAPNHRQHEKLYHWVYVAGVTLLTGVVDFLFLWPESHLVALLVFATWLSLVAIYEMTSYGFARYSIELAVIALFCGALIANSIIGPIVVPPVVGWLQPANERTPANGCDLIPPNRKPAEGPIILIGNATFIPPNPDSFDAIEIGQCAGLAFRRTPEGVAVTTDLYSPQGKLIGRVHDNGYSVAGDERLIVERSGDLSTLVVHDRAGIELLYVRVLNRNGIRVRGTFSCPLPQLRTVIVTDEGIKTTGFMFVVGCTTGVRVGMKF